MNILQSPDIVLEHILSFLSFDEISKMRLVCKAFNKAGQRLLNRGFFTMEQKQNAFLKIVKSKLPRRESERRSHPLSRHCDILTSIETRISMMSMTYSKYIEQNLCCFIPGKVIDEVLRVLKILEGTDDPPRAHEILQELRDISSMAIEHFDEKICPLLKLSRPCLNARPAKCHLPSTSQDSSPSRDMSNFSMAFNNVIVDKLLSDTLTKKFIALTNEFKKTKETIAEQHKCIRRQMRTIKNQGKQVVELKRRIDDWETKHKEISANVNQIHNFEHNQPIRQSFNTDNVLKNVAPVLNDMLENAVKIDLPAFKSNIKPRMAQITLKRNLRDVLPQDYKKIKFSK